MIHAVLAINNKSYIGLNGGLPWGRNEKDLAYFRKMIEGRIVVVGRKTYETIPKLLKTQAEHVYVISGGNIDLPKLLTSAKEDLYIIGGKSIYEQAAPYVDVWHVTRIDDDTIGDTLLDLEQLLWVKKPKT